ncbi:unnamed protein product [Ilex paraguariensis]|uniref:Uncharacterized protein n=1 Tax=Ilex paraguariensis TaxID=185542 RepID=A0ABC8UDL9_9AQUA
MAANASPSSSKPSISPLPPPTSTPFHEQKQQPQQVNREVQLTALVEDYVIWDPAPYSGRGGPAPIPHPRVVAPLASSTRTLSTSKLAACMTMVIIMMIPMAANASPSSSKPSISPLPPPTSTPFHEQKQQPQQVNREVQLTALVEDYVIWDPAPYSGRGGPAPIPHPRVVAPLASSTRTLSTSKLAVGT